MQTPEPCDNFKASSRSPPLLNPYEPGRQLQLLSVSLTALGDPTRIWESLPNKLSKGRSSRGDSRCQENGEAALIKRYSPHAREAERRRYVISISRPRLHGLLGSGDMCIRIDETLIANGCLPQ